MISKKASEPFGDDDLPTTAEDAGALRRHRPTAADDWLEQITVLSAAFAATPRAVAARRERRTFAGLPPFEL
ncbi:MAG TPA: hypothetical protein VKY89_12875 [Thermoanaerobaculia bacterium]|jgi:hypothetical protein|nr:hypothetical protein [Thermoanaerobaculia bacterium]